MRDLHDAGCELLTITQYLRPSPAAPPGGALGAPGGVRRAGRGGRARSASPACCPARWCARPTAPAGSTGRPSTPAGSPRPTAGAARAAPVSSSAWRRTRRRRRRAARPARKGRPRRSRRRRAARSGSRSSRRTRSPGSGTARCRGGWRCPSSRAFGVLLLVQTLVAVPIWLAIPTAVLFGVLALMLVFGRRAQKAAFSQVDGQPGAAGWVLQNMRGDWRVYPGRAGQLAARRGAPGARPARRGAGRRGPAAPGARADGAGEEAGGPDRRRHPDLRRAARRRGGPGVRSAGSTRTWSSCPATSARRRSTRLDKRLAALGGTKAPPLPKGPMPTRARMSGLERTLRRR